jgi:hypothetical protein
MKVVPQAVSIHFIYRKPKKVGVMAHAYNPSLRGRDWKDNGLRPAQEKG